MGRRDPTTSTPPSGRLAQVRAVADRGRPRLFGVCAVALGVLVLAGAARAVEMKLYDGSRMAVLVEGYERETGEMTVYMSSGEEKSVRLRSVAAIYYSGRPDHFVRTGDQAFHFTAGGHICAAVENLTKGETLTIRSQSLGRHVISIASLHGFTALAMEGMAARRAEDLLRPDGVPDTPENAFLDHIIDRRGVPYAGVIESFTQTRLEFEHDEQLQQVEIGTFKVAGARLAEAAKDKSHTRPGVDVLQVGVACRDKSYVTGTLESVDPFEWRVRPNFDPGRRIHIPASEITKVDVLGGRAVFLSQLHPVETDEQTIIAPPQPYVMNANAQGELMNIGGFIYHNGVGVHARSRLTFRLDGKFQAFKADVGIDGRLEMEGSVVFRVIGDGKVLYQSPVVRGRISGGGLPIDVSVKDVEELTLSVDPTDDLDQADLANWGAARVVR